MPSALLSTSVLLGNNLTYVAPCSSGCGCQPAGRHLLPRPLTRSPGQLFLLVDVEHFLCVVPNAYSEIQDSSSSWTQPLSLANRPFISLFGMPLFDFVVFFPSMFLSLCPTDLCLTIFWAPPLYLWPHVWTGSGSPCPLPPPIHPVQA